MARRAQGSSVEGRTLWRLSGGVRAYSVRLASLRAVRAASGRCEVISRRSSGGRLRRVAGPASALLLRGSMVEMPWGFGGRYERADYICISEADVLISRPAWSAYNLQPYLPSGHNGCVILRSQRRSLTQRDPDIIETKEKKKD